MIEGFCVFVRRHDCYFPRQSPAIHRWSGIRRKIYSVIHIPHTTNPTMQNDIHTHTSITLQNNLINCTIGISFDIRGSVHRKYIPKYNQKAAVLHILFISLNCSTCFGWYLHPSSGAHTTVSTASGSSNGLTSNRYCRYSCVCS